MSQPGRGGRADRKSWRLWLEAVSKGLEKSEGAAAVRKAKRRVTVPVPTLEERDALAAKQFRALDIMEENPWAGNMIHRMDGREELACKKHGTGHPHRELTELYGTTWEDWMGTHGCCGCCVPVELGEEGSLEEAAGWED